MQLRHAASTDTGRSRDHNEDTYVVEPNPPQPELGALFLICDGMGGAAAGEVASDLAAKTIITHYYAMPGHDPGAALQTSFLEANRRVWQEGRGKMGTTGVAALFLDNAAVVANVGDSRAYLLRAGVITQLTEDHTFVAEQVSAGVLTDDEAKQSSYRHVITRALGHRAEVEIDLFQTRLEPADRVLLCSDGLYGVVEANEMLDIAGSGPLQERVDALITLANERGGPDNITTVLIEVVEVQPGPSITLPAPAKRTTGSRPARQPKRGTERLPVSPAGASAAGPAASTPRPHRATAPPPPVARPRRAPLLGLLLMTVLALVLLGGAGYAFMTGAINFTVTPTAVPAPTLTPLGSSLSAPDSTATSAPTLVPTSSSAADPPTTASPLSPAP